MGTSRPEILQQRFLASYPELGCYVLSFYKHEQWLQVIVDDRLPVIYREMRRGHWQGKAAYIFAGVETPLGSAHPSHEVWLAIIEKAYAKLHGGYSALEGGFACHAVRDLTGCGTDVSDPRLPSL